MTRSECLEKANEIVTGARNEEYGEPEDSFHKISELWSAYLREKCVSPGADVTIEASDVAAMMILLKIARIAAGTNKQDNWIDIAGYAACGCSFCADAGNQTGSRMTEAW